MKNYQKVALAVVLGAALVISAGASYNAMQTLTDRIEERDRQTAEANHHIVASYRVFKRAVEVVNTGKNTFYIYEVDTSTTVILCRDDKGNFYIMNKDTLPN